MNGRNLPILVVGLALVVALVGACSTPADRPPPQQAATTMATPTPEPTPTPAPTPTPPTYQEVVAALKKKTRLCRTLVYLHDVLRNGNLMVSTSEKGTQYERAPNDPSIKCIGAQVVVTSTIRLDGKRYRRGDFLTVDGDNNWVRVRSWE